MTAAWQPPATASGARALASAPWTGPAEIGRPRPSSDPRQLAFQQLAIIGEQEFRQLLVAHRAAGNITPAVEAIGLAIATLIGLGVISPTEKQISGIARYKVRAVGYAKARLIELGVLKSKRRGQRQADGTWRRLSNEYQLTLPLGPVVISRREGDTLRPSGVPVKSAGAAAHSAPPPICNACRTSRTESKEERGRRGLQGGAQGATEANSPPDGYRTWQEFHQARSAKLANDWLRQRTDRFRHRATG